MNSEDRSVISPLNSQPHSWKGSVVSSDDYITSVSQLPQGIKNDEIQQSNKLFVYGYQMPKIGFQEFKHPWCYFGKAKRKTHAQMLCDNVAYLPNRYKYSKLKDWKKEKWG